MPKNLKAAVEVAYSTGFESLSPYYACYAMIQIPYSQFNTLSLNYRKHARTLT